MKKKMILSGIMSVLMIAASVAGAFVIMTACDTKPAVKSEVSATSTGDEAEFDDSRWGGHSGETEGVTPYGETFTMTQEEWDSLKSINDEIKGWIYVPNTEINYPVLKHEGDGVGSQYYLHRNYDKSYLYAGSIFIDYRSKGGEDARHVITHGHNMNNGTMYADLLDYGKYTGNMEAYKNAPVLFFCTDEGVEQWVIFSVYKTNTLERHGTFFNYLVGDFETDAQYMNYIYNIKERSLFDVPVPMNEEDKIITLSTCSYEYTDFRTVVVARRVRQGEDIKPYIDGAKLNENPLWPDVYYTDHNATAPEITSFKTEYTAETLDWYDGKGNLAGDEWLPTAGGRKSYTVSFLDKDGEIIKTEIVSHGKSATPPPDPENFEDEFYVYTFEGWQLDYTNVKCNMKIAPNYSYKLKEE